MAADQYIPQRADIIREKFCWSHFPDISGKDVLCFTQDSTGNLWFGLGNGIMRYDGLHWKQFTQTHGLPNSYLSTLITSQDGTVYGLYETLGVYTLRDTLWHPVQTINPDSSTRFWDLTPISPDTFWVATSHGALFYTKSKSLLYRDSDVYTVDKNGDWDKNRKQDPDWNIHSIYEDNDNNLWIIDVANQDSRLYQVPQWKRNLNSRLNWNSFSWHEKGVPFGVHPRIFQSSDGTYWIYTYSEMAGLFRFRNPQRNWMTTDLTQLGGDNLVISMMETKDKTIWLGGNGFLYAYRNNQFTVYTPETLDIQIAPIKLLQTLDGALWLLSVNIDVNRIDYSRSQWDVFNDIHYQCTSPEGFEFYLSSSGRIIRHDQMINQWISYGPEDGLMEMPSTILCTQDGEIWAAGSDKGIAAASQFGDNQWATQTFPELSWSISYQSAMEASDGSIWFGSMSDPSAQFKGGVIIYPRKDSSRIWWHLKSSKRAYNRMSVLTQSGDNRIWAGGSQLMVLNSLEWNLVEEPNELQKGWIDYVLGTPDSSLWVAKSGVGIFHLKNGKWKKYTTEDNLISNMTVSLLRLADGHILAATKNGISLFDGRSWIKYALPPEIYIPRESGTMRVDPEGRIWINQAPRIWYFRALEKNVSRLIQPFRTIRYQGDTLAPETRITTFNDLISKPGNQYITWEGFDNWGATSQAELSFSYRLDDEPWTNYTSDRMVQLLNITEGTHRFRVRAMDRDRNVDPHPAHIVFKVIPPVWKQAWFLLLITSFFSIIIGLLIILSLQNRKLSDANRKIEKIASFKERFFLNLSHEVRTPLTMILARVSEMLSSKNGDWGKDRKQLETIRHHGHYLLRLVNQMLDFRKMELGKYQLKVAQGDIISYIHNVFSLFNVFATEHRIKYRFQSDGPSLYAWFDAEKIEIILMNLIGNAFKYTPDTGNIKVEVSVNKNVSGNNDLPKWIEIHVTDTGIGIPADRLEHIFDRFYHVEHPGQLFYDSIGIGLDFTKEIVELHQGNISVDSEECEGTTFHVKLPVWREAYPADAIEEAPIQTLKVCLSQQKIEEIKEERNRLQGKRIRQIQSLSSEEARKLPKLLIVEDHPEMQEMLARYFENEYEVILAENGKEGMKIAFQEVPDLIISDVMMPEMDGIELTKHIKTNIITSHIPILLLTVKSETEHRIEGFETGADAYIPKPFEFDELRIRVQKLIESRELLRERFSKEVEIDPKSVTVNRLDESFLEKCIALIEENISKNNFNVDQLCHELGMSRSQAYKKVKSISGFALNEFIIQLKLKRTAKMLIETDLNISEIAYELGFSDHSHMNRHFRKAFNCSPKEYRRKNFNN